MKVGELGIPKPDFEGSEEEVAHWYQKHGTDAYVAKTSFLDFITGLSLPLSLLNDLEAMHNYQLRIQEAFNRLRSGQD